MLALFHVLDNMLLLLLLMMMMLMLLELSVPGPRKSIAKHMRADFNYFNESIELFRIYLYEGIVPKEMPLAPASKERASVDMDVVW